MTDLDNTRYQQRYRSRQRSAGKAYVSVWLDGAIVDRIDKLVPKGGSRADVIEAAFAPKGTRRQPVEEGQ